MTVFPDAIMRIASAVRKHGGSAFVVGGSVRDMLLNLPPKDFDIEVYGVNPDDLEAMIRGLNPEAINVVGRSFGVMKATFGDLEIDISIPRRESKVSSGHRGFQIQGDPNLPYIEGARRRDFTINAMMMDPFTGDILDFFGGQDDLARGLLRRVDAKTFSDDPLRVLRAVQFASRFGFRIEDNTFFVCRLMVNSELVSLPASRIGEEWRKMLLRSENPSVGLSLGRDLGIWSILHPDLIALRGIQQDPNWHPEGDAWAHSLMALDVAAQIVRREELEGDDALVILLAALCHDFGKASTTKASGGNLISHGHDAAGVEPTQRFLSQLMVASSIQNRVTRLVAEHMFSASHRHGETTDSAVRRLSRRLAPATIQELAWVMEADVRGRDCEPQEGRLEASQELVQRARTLEVAEGSLQRILMGRHLIEHLALVPSPQFGEILKAVEEEQIAGRVTDLESAIEAAQKVATT